MTMGEYIKYLRTQKGLSQEELGKMVGVNRAAVNKWETGVVENIKRSTIRDLARVLCVSPCDLMRWDDEENLKKVQQEVNACEMFEKCYGKESFEMVAMFLRLDSIDRIAMKGAMSALLQQDKYLIKEGLKNA